MGLNERSRWDLHNGPRASQFWPKSVEFKKISLTSLLRVIYPKAGGQPFQLRQPFKLSSIRYVIWDSYLIQDELVCLASVYVHYLCKPTYSHHMQMGCQRILIYFLKIIYHKLLAISKRPPLPYLSPIAVTICYCQPVPNIMVYTKTRWWST